MSQPAKKIRSLIPVGKGGGHRFEKRMHWYFFGGGGELWAWMLGLFPVILLVCLLCVLEKISKLKTTNGDAKRVDEELIGEQASSCPSTP